LQNGDYLGEEAHRELTERGFRCLFGFVEQFTCRYSWDEGSVSEYLGSTESSSELREKPHVGKDSGKAGEKPPSFGRLRSG